MALRMKHHLGLSMSELRFDPSPMRVRARVGGAPAVDTVSAMLVWEPRRLVPAYAVPLDDLAGDVRPVEPQPTEPDPSAWPPMLGPDSFAPHFSPGRVADLLAGAVVREEAVFLPDDPDLAGYAVLRFDAFDSWTVEEQELVGHPRDPFKRIDVWASDRTVEVSLDGRLLASTSAPLMLVETHLPVRWYIPPRDVRMELLVPSDQRSTCAYKGHASYLSLADGSEAGRDIGWRYQHPLDDALRVRHHVCFWSERTDLVVDGTRLPRPVTPWSTPEEQAGADPDRLEFG